MDGLRYHYETLKYSQQLVSFYLEGAVNALTNLSTISAIVTTELPSFHFRLIMTQCLNFP